jgi:UDP-N-acetylmuramate dehydrogenase
MKPGSGTTPSRKTARQGPSRSALKSALEGVRGEVRFNLPLKTFTSFNIGGPADVFVTPADEEDVARLVRQAHRERIPVFVLGGTNVLIQDRGIRGIVVGLSHLKTVRVETGHLLYAEAGVGMPTLIKRAITLGLSGLEWAAGIPGTVGGCVVMNAGTRLGEMKDALSGVRMAFPDGSLRDLGRTDIGFEYRRALLPDGIVVGARLQLKPAPKTEIERVVKDYLRYRKDTQPLTEANAGCVFKNPGPQTAGQLVEAAGLKGEQVGGAQVSTKHANFIVNRGRASAADVLALIRLVQDRVKAASGVDLQLELKVVGEG